jgi:MYXO-CTERM domain-containing protein
VAPLLLAALIGANPGWPPPADLEPESYALPVHQPDDPGYAPGPRCQGQRGLYSFRPACLTGVGPEGPSATGSSIDRAWALTTGRPDVVIAVVGSGVDLADPELVGRYLLNPGELSPPQRGGQEDFDPNGDGVFTVLDYTSATGTTAPTIDRVLDLRLLARADRGDVDGNGLLDPRDLIAIFADGRDDDGNGWVDDLVGYNFYAGDPVPSGEASALASTIGAAANDGRKLAGVCPRCGILPLLVSPGAVARADVMAEAVRYARSRGVVVLASEVAVLTDSPALVAAVTEAQDQLSIVVGRGRLGGRQSPWPATLDVLRIGSVGLDRRAPEAATAIAWPDPRSGEAAELALMAPAPPGPEAIGLAAGVLGLLHAAALDAGPGPTRSLSAPEARGVLLATASDLVGAPRTGAGWDRRTGAGRIEAAAAVAAVRSGRLPPSVEFLSPSGRVTFDPSPGTPVEVEIRVTNPGGQALSYQVESAPGQDPSPDQWSSLASGTLLSGGPMEVSALLPTVGLSADPTAPWSETADGAITLRATVRADGGGVQEQRRVIFLHRDLDLWPAFPLGLGASVWGPPRIGEDGAIWLGTGTGQLLRVDAKGLVNLVAQADQAILSAPSLGSDGRWSMLDEGAVLHDPSGPRSTSVQSSSVAPGGQTTAPVLIDLDGDGLPEHVVARADGHLLIFGASGPAQVDVRLDGPAGTPAVGDLDGDGRPELVVATANRLHFLDAEGAAFAEPLVLPKAPGAADRHAAYLPSPALADLDDDGRLDVALVLAGRGPVLVYGGDLRVRVELDLLLSGTRWSATHQQLAVADLDADDRLELLFLIHDLDDPEKEPGTERALALAALHADGSWLPGFPRPVPDGSALDFTVVDLDGDRRPEVVIPGTESLMALAYDGSVVRRFPKLVGAPLAGPPAVGDLDGDGLLELAAATVEGQLFVWRTRGPAAERIPWAGFHHDQAATGNLAQSTRLRRVNPPTSTCACSSSEEGRGPDMTPIMLLLGLAQIRRRRVD